MTKLNNKQLRKLKNLANRAAKAQENEHNYQDAQDSTPNINDFENYAESLGYKTLWTGLYPILQKNGQEIYIS